MELHELNDLSLECIFKELPLVSQFSVLYVSTYFRSVIISMWRRQYRKEKKLSLPLECDETIESYFKKHKEALAIFVPLISEYIEELTVTGAKVLNLMRAHKWPKLIHLEAHIEFDAEIPNLQFADEIFHGLESLDLSWCTKHVDYKRVEKIRNDLALSTCERFTKKCMDEDELDESLSYEIKIPECRELCPRKYSTRELLTRVTEYVSALTELRCKLKVVTTQKLNLFKSMKLKNLRKLKVNQFSAQHLYIEQMPQLQELHYENHRLSQYTHYEPSALLNFFQYIETCINKQVTEKTRQQPLRVVCYYSDPVSFRRLHDIAQGNMWNLFWVEVPFKGDSDLMPLYFAIPASSRKREVGIENMLKFRDIQ